MAEPGEQLFVCASLLLTLLCYVLFLLLVCSVFDQFVFCFDCWNKAWFVNMVNDVSWFFVLGLLLRFKLRRSDECEPLNPNTIYQTLTRSISSDSIWAVTVSLLLLHLFLHDYSGSPIRAPGALKTPNLTSCISLNASIVASVFVASRLPSRLHVFAVLLFSLQFFLFAPLVTYCIKKFSFGLHLVLSFALMGLTMSSIYALHRLFFLVFLLLVLLVNVVCPYWLIRMQEYKFEINGPWDEAKLCFDITD